MLTVNSKTKKLPDCYNKEANSYNNKILTLDSELQFEFHNSLVEVYESLDLDKASGKTLDLYGTSVGQVRGSLTDEQYRILIMIKIARNTAGVDYNAIINILSVILNCNKSEISIVNAERPATVEIQSIPLHTLIKAGFTSGQVLKMLNMLLPVCVTIENADFSGTFEFGDNSTDYDVNKGFGNVEQNIGGYLGMFIENGNDALPE